MYAKTDDASGKLVHDDENPMTLQQPGRLTDRFATKQVQAPQAIFRVTERRYLHSFREKRNQKNSTHYPRAERRRTNSRRIGEVDYSGSGQD